jgi:hypothetical protein
MPQEPARGCASERTETVRSRARRSRGANIIFYITTTRFGVRDRPVNCVLPSEGVDSVLFNPEKIVSVPMRVKTILK